MQKPILLKLEKGLSFMTTHVLKMERVEKLMPLMLNTVLINFVKPMPTTKDFGFFKI
jgi:hypothetical protein